MESSASSKDSKRSLIWNHFTQIASDDTNITRSVCNHSKKELKCSWTGMTSSMIKITITIRFDTKFKIIAQLFDLIRNDKILFAQHYC